MAPAEKSGMANRSVCVYVCVSVYVSTCVGCVIHSICPWKSFFHIDESERVHVYMYVYMCVCVLMHLSTQSYVEFRVVTAAMHTH